MAILNKHNILVRPLLTEKTSFMKENNKYLFEVHKDASKIEIKKALKDLFNVDAVSVNTINCLGKKKRMGRFEGQKSDWKKAIVTFKKDAKISFIEEA